MWITNVRLEKEFVEQAPGKFVIRTEPAALRIEEGRIAEITGHVPDDAEDVLDAKGYLLLPSLADNHIHLDKGHYGGPWQAVVPANGVRDRIKEEQGFLKDFLPDTPKKAQALIDLICGKGATFLRVQVNVDPTVELENLRVIQEVLEQNQDRLDYEIVAFPQHGTLETEVTGLLTQAAAEPAVSVIGGLDPATIDNDIERSLRLIFTLADNQDKQVDIHLHDRGTLGSYEINRIMDYTEEFHLEGRVQISHALALADIPYEELQPVAERLGRLDVAINTTVPIDIRPLPIPFLQRFGVRVNVINDNINDHWSPFGTGDLIERASRAAEAFAMKDERSLTRALGLVTKGKTPLDAEGNYSWPNVGDEASFLFTKAESSAHLIARVLPERVVMFKGNVVSGMFE